ncbi:hypothetical protein RND71_042325 [Anisodus tanguticus]|uniref:mannan endo-1,4-beta-mannosidase n=1 Tax=Anisodus tanguticus TaxID=243964 RepID=A0AAE1UMW8_9SOLA|nr:hypothetical protein RND71_042325 [Anisodus tanguticus]
MLNGHEMQEYRLTVKMTSILIQFSKIITRIMLGCNKVQYYHCKDDPTIMAWELINEPCCKADYSGKIVNGWVQEMAIGTDFINSHLIKEIDFATIHAHTDQWLSGQNDDAQMAFMQRWITSHWDDSSRVLKKPLVLAEFGKSSKDPGYNLSARDTFMNSVHVNVYSYAIYGGTMGGSLVWQLAAQGMENFDDGYSIT